MKNFAISKTKLIILAAVLVVVLVVVTFAVLHTSGRVDLANAPLIGRLFNGGAGSVVIVDMGPQYISPIGLAVNDDGYLFVADETGMRVLMLSHNHDNDADVYYIPDPSSDSDPATGVVREYQTNMPVNNVYYKDGRLFVLKGGLAGYLAVVNPENMRQTALVEVGHTPMSVAISGGNIFVINRFSNDITVVDIDSFEYVQTIELSGREPMSAQLVGNYLFIGNNLPEGSSMASVVSAKINVVDTAAMTEINVLPLVNGSLSAKGMVASPDGSTIYVTHLVNRYAFPRSQTDRGWQNTNAMSIIDVASQLIVATVLLDQTDLGAPNPWGIDITADGRYLVVAIAGTHDVIVIDVEGLNQKLDDVRSGTGLVPSLDVVVDYIPFLDGARERISLPGNGPRPVVVNGENVYIGQYFTGNIAVLNLESRGISTIELGDQPEFGTVRRGQILFHDGELIHQSWFSCISCHPGVRADGMNWDNVGERRLGIVVNTQSLLYSYRTPPARATGTAAWAGAITHGSFTLRGLTPEELEDVDNFIRAELPVPSPRLNRDGTLTEAAIRGRDLFELSCIACHSGPNFTDLRIMDVGTLLPSQWEYQPMVVPTLVEIWRSAPWFNHGSVYDMRDVVRHFAPELSESEVADLAEYVLSIGMEGELYGVEQMFVYRGGSPFWLSNMLEPGIAITAVTVRNQYASAPPAKLVIELFDPSSNAIAGTRQEHELGEMSFNAVVRVELYGNGITVPDTLQPGSYVRLSIVPLSGNDILATDLTFVYR